LTIPRPSLLPARASLPFSIFKCNAHKASPDNLDTAKKRRKTKSTEAPAAGKFIHDEREKLLKLVADLSENLCALNALESDGLLQVQLLRDEPRE
jgi:hypothetical protein